jgi:hypothetical protein
LVVWSYSYLFCIEKGVESVIDGLILDTFLLRGK